MEEKNIKLFKLFGFEVKVNPSWLIILFLVVWSLSVGFFPYNYKDMTDVEYWTMGFIGALGLFGSIIVHEFAHSYIARKNGIPMKGISLFIFGGIAEMDEEPKDPVAELKMAVVGPITSLLLGAGFLGLFFLSRQQNWTVYLVAVTHYLGIINIVLAVFNMVPAFPLDGGRVFRSILWKLQGDIKWATRIATSMGKFISIMLIIIGALNIFAGNIVGGMWWILIGLFLRSAASFSYEQVVLKRALEGESIKKFMNTEPVTVSPHLTVSELVDDYIYKYHFKMFPVVEDHKLAGCITTREVKELGREKWEETKVEDILTRCDSSNIISADEDPMKVLTKMSSDKNSRLMVVEDDELLGIIALKDMLNFLSLKLELEDEEN
ncbi:MAG: site-2 protease family protein [Vulcanimicrobiota bacterium]